MSSLISSCLIFPFMAMKGKIKQEEINELMNDFSVLQIQEIKVPYLEATRHFVFIKRK